MLLGACVPEGIGTPRPPSPTSEEESYKYEQTRKLVALVDDAAQLVEAQGRKAFTELSTPDSRWRRGETYIFVLDTQGNMLVHLDRGLEGENQLGLKDVKGRPIVRGLIRTATTNPDASGGWYHYEWPVPGGMLPRWKSSYVRLITVPSGEALIVGSGMYNDRMEKVFVVDMVKDAAAEIEKRGQAAFSLLRDQTGPYVVKDSYIFVVDPNGVELVNPAFPNLEGRNLLNVEDTEGKPMVREMLEVVEREGSGWVRYMWPKPGESVSTQKSTYVTKAHLDGDWVLVASGVYLADAPQAKPDPDKPSAPELMVLVRDAASLLEQRGASAYEDFRQQGSKWLRGDTYLFVWNLDGMRTFHGADPDLVGTDATGGQDIHGRPYGRMFLDTATRPPGEGWVHYMYPQPGSLFPTWKSSFIKRVVFPSGEEHLVGAGIYNMEMNRAFIVDLVDRAAELVAEQGEESFDQLRDKQGPFVFMDVYVFVNEPDGTELVNPAQPGLEGMNIGNLRDARGEMAAREYIDAALKKGAAWVEYYWYKPGDNEPSPKQTYVRRVQSGPHTYVVGSGFYPND